MVSFARSLLLATILVFATLAGQCAGTGGGGKGSKFYRLRRNLCLPFPQETDWYDVLNPEAPFTTPGDRLILHSTLYNVKNGGKDCDLTDPAATGHGFCTTTDPDAYIYYCSINVVDADGSFALTITIDIDLPVPEEEQRQVAITGGTGAYAGVNGYGDVKIVRSDVVNNVGIEYYSYWARDYCACEG